MADAPSAPARARSRPRRRSTARNLSPEPGSLGRRAPSTAGAPSSLGATYTLKLVAPDRKYRWPSTDRRVTRNAWRGISPPSANNPHPVRSRQPSSASNRPSRPTPADGSAGTGVIGVPTASSDQSPSPAALLARTRTVYFGLAPDVGLVVVLAGHLYPLVAEGRAGDAVAGPETFYPARHPPEHEGVGTGDRG